MKPITVLIVDDSALIRQMFTELLNSEPDIQVLDTARDPIEAREKIKKLNPDVLTLDIEMPKMDGISFLERIMSLRPMPVIMVSSLTQRGADATLQALELGAFETIAKPVENQTEETISLLRYELATKVRAAANAKILRHIRAASPPQETIHFCPKMNSRNVIAIGASTGGVETLKDIFQRLPGNAPPIVITQHMPERFTRSFAARLDSVSQMRVMEAEDGGRLAVGHAYLAPGDRHLKVVRNKAGEFACKLEDSPNVSGHKPSVDVLFHSVANAVGPYAVGIILTGMGKDGAVGLKAMRDNGAFTIGQNEASCVVYGMPAAAMKIGAVQMEASLNTIPSLMLQHCEKRKERV